MIAHRFTALVAMAILSISQCDTLSAEKPSKKSPVLVCEIIYPDTKGMHTPNMPTHKVAFPLDKVSSLPKFSELPPFITPEVKGLNNMGLMKPMKVVVKLNDLTETYEGEFADSCMREQYVPVGVPVRLLPPRGMDVQAKSAQKGFETTWSVHPENVPLPYNQQYGVAVQLYLRKAVMERGTFTGTKTTESGSLFRKTTSTTKITDQTISFKALLPWQDIQYFFLCKPFRLE